MFPSIYKNITKQLHINIKYNLNVLYIYTNNIYLFNILHGHFCFAINMLTHNALLFYFFNWNFYRWRNLYRNIKMLRIIGLCFSFVIRNNKHYLKIFALKHTLDIIHPVQFFYQVVTIKVFIKPSYTVIKFLKCIIIMVV